MQPTPQPSPTPRWRRLLRALWVVVVVVAIGVALVNRAEEVRGTLSALSPAGILAAGVTVIAGVGLSCGLWRALLAGLGSPLPARAAAQVFFVGQLGKYVPGSVWPVLAQMEYGRDHDVPPRSSAAAFALFMVAVLASGLVVAALTVPLLGPPSVAWTAVAPLGLLVFVPAVQRQALRIGLRVLRRPPLSAVPDSATMLRAGMWSLGLWAVWGLHLWLLVDALGGYGIGVVYATGVFAAAWSAGFAALPAPAGAGVREAVLVALLLPAVPAGGGLAIAVVSRLLFTVADLVWGAVGFAAGRNRASSGV